MAREEIIAGPLELYLADLGEAFPLVDAAPAGNWALVGASGDENYTDDGVSLNLPQSIEEFVPAGSTMAVKAFRTEESVEFVVTVADVRNEVLQAALNGNEITAATGESEISLLRGGDVHEHALFARGKSPYEDGGTGQFQVPRCYMSGEPEIVYTKGEPSAVELTFRSLLPAEADVDDLKVIYTDASIV